MESVKLTACKNRKPPGTFEQLNKPTTYNVEGKTFIVEPVFKQDTMETIGTILVNLMRTDASQF